METKNIDMAYITILTSESYIMGCVVLDRSLKMLKSKYPLVVVCPEDIDADVFAQLSKYGVNYVTQSNLPQNIILRSNKVDYWNATLFKIKVFDMLQYKKIVFLDSDMIVLKNIDHLFELGHMSAVAAGSVLHSEWDGELNSGMMVLEPNHDDYLSLLDCIEPAYKFRTESELGFGDQDIIKMNYKSWPDNDRLHLPEKYNTMLGYGGCLKRAGEIESYDDIYVYHFTGKEKPWHKSFISQIIILIKIIKRAKFESYIDFKAYKQFKKLLRELVVK